MSSQVDSSEATSLARHAFGERGFTLFELLMTLIVAAALLAFAVPGLSSFITSSRLRASQSEFVAALTLARSEATKRGGQVVVRAVGATVGSEFLGGWLVFADTDGDGNFDSGEPLVREYAPLLGQLRFSTWYGSNATDVAIRAAFNSRGFLAPTTENTDPKALNFRLCGPPGTTRGYDIKLEPVGLADVVEMNLCT